MCTPVMWWPHQCGTTTALRTCCCSGMMVSPGAKSSLHKASPPRRRPACHDHNRHWLRLSAAAPCRGSLPAVLVRSQQQQQGPHVQQAASSESTTTSNTADVADDDERLQVMEAADSRSPLLLAASLIPPTVNWHLETRCNYRCKFCFATFEDVREYQQAVRQDQVMPAEMDDDDDSTGSSSSSKEQRRLLSEDRQQLSLKVPAMLKEQGVSKLNFVGGEPFLHPFIFQLIAAAKQAGLTTSVVTNGSCLTADKLLRLKGTLDWLAFSVDASNDEMHAIMGRGLQAELVRSTTTSLSSSSSVMISSAYLSEPPVPAGLRLPSRPPQQGLAARQLSGGSAGSSNSVRLPEGHLARVLPLWFMAKEMGFRMKLNTVVTRANLDDDMSHLVVALAPERWKVFQVLPMEGQNDGSVEPLLISGEEFKAWVSRHRQVVEQAGVPLVEEGNDDMLGTYAMLDAENRFYTNAAGHHEYGPSIFEVEGGVAEAWSVVAGRSFQPRRFLERGGLYDWGQSRQERNICQEQLLSQE